MDTYHNGVKKVQIELLMVKLPRENLFKEIALKIQSVAF
jgi:hypothetical protein